MNVFDLPFDQYQRYRAVSDLLASADAGPPGLVLEVGGGFESRLSAFLPETEVVIADLEVAPGTTFVRPVRADGCRLPFRDRTFPAAITIDTTDMTFDATAARTAYADLPPTNLRNVLSQTARDRQTDQ